MAIRTSNMQAPGSPYPPGTLDYATATPHDQLSALWQSGAGSSWGGIGPQTLQQQQQRAQYSPAGQPNPYPPGYIGPGGQQMNPVPAGGAPQGMNYTNGPAGSSGGLSGNPYMPQTQGQQQPTQYGYGTAPSQGGMGYYQQDTPLGAFAAANQQYSQGQARTPQQFAGTSLADNPYIGRTTQGIAGAPSVLPYAQAGQYQNPYLGAQSQQAGSAGTNAYAGQNPYLSQAVGDSLGLAADSFRDTVLPQFDRMDRQSGSFGNTGVQAARERALGQFGRSQSQAATQAYMQDYGMQQGLAENQLNRNQQNNQFNAGLGAADLGRNLAGGFAQAGMNNGLTMQGAMFDAGNALQGQQFNAGLQQADLGRNTNAALGLGTFNAGQSNQMGQFNAGQGNQLGQFWAQLGQGNNQFNASQGNSMNLANTGWANSMLENSRNRTQQQGQFDANLDRGIWNDNMNWMRTGQQDQLSLLGMLSGMGQQGIGNAGTIQNTPMNYWQQFANTGMGLGGMGGTNSQQMQGNPLLGFLGGWQLGSGYFGG